MPGRALHPAPAPAVASGRAEKAAARREAILAAALDEFSASGFAATRLDDVAKRAGVAKGTIYLYFADKEALFQELVRTMISPLITTLESVPAADIPARVVLTRFADLFASEVYRTKRRAVLHLIVSEGARFPSIAEFYYREVVERAMVAMRHVIERGIARGEIEHTALARFPQLVAAPAIAAVVWGGMFERFAPLDVENFMHAHIEVLLAKGGRS